ncbi:hypothetical protein GEMRC1_013710 [Eukaryota sp. GEM-RC1]
MRTAVSRQSTATAGVARPMTAVRAAGFSSVPQSRAGLSTSSGTGYRTSAGVGVGGTAFNPFNMEAPVDDKITNAKKIEREIDQLVYQSTLLTEAGEHMKALEKAKEAAQKERDLSQQKERKGQADTINIDLTYTVLFNLANCYEQAEVFQEALNTYTQIIDNKRYAHAGRLKLNMGNVYFKQGDYQSAIKYYRMALDQVTSICKSVKLKIMRSLCIAFVKTNRWSDAVDTFERITEEGVDVTSSYNLCACHFALGNAQALRDSFIKLLTLDSKYRPQEQILAAARLVILIDVQDLTFESAIMEGLEFVISSMEAAGWYELSGIMLLEKANELMKQGLVDESLSVLTSFEKKDESIRLLAHPNLSFVQFNLGDYDKSFGFATSALEHDPYSIEALVNLSACHITSAEYDQARDLAVRALRIDVRCFEALYNLALSLYGLGQTEDALRAFRKLNQTHPESTDVIWMVAVLYERIGDVEEALKWFNFLLARCPTDVGTLRRISEILDEEGDDINALNCYQEAYRYLPVDIDVISKLAAHCVQHELYEKALELFSRTSQVQPHKTDWKLMMGMCHRRMGEFQTALKLYLEVLEKEPQNRKCLKYIIQIYTELEQVDKVTEYSNKLALLTNADERRSARSARSKSARSVASLKSVPRSAQSLTEPKTISSLSRDEMAQDIEEEEEDDWVNVELNDDLLPM